MTDEQSTLRQTCTGIQVNMPPVTTSSLLEILRAGHPFVDKTGLIEDLFVDYERAFLARPRKWGKTTLLSTMKMILEGGEENRELLKNLDIVKRASEFRWLDWKQRPVLVFDFSKLDDRMKEQPFLYALMDEIRSMTKEYEIDLSKYDHGENLKFFFSCFIEDLSKKLGTQVSVLVDEYDAPIINALHSTNLSLDERLFRACENRQTIENFFTSLKSMDGHTFRCFTTGLDHFSMTGLFTVSDVFVDITFNQWLSQIAGYTWKEIETAYKPLLDQLATTLNGKEEGDLRKILEENYGGYSWFDGGTEESRLFNPWDINNCLDKQTIAPYWTNYGVSSRLLKRLDPCSIRKLKSMDREYSLSSMMSVVYDPHFIRYHHTDPARVLVQYGYLSVKQGRFGHRDWMMKMDFPNPAMQRYVCEQLPEILHQLKTYED